MLTMLYILLLSFNISYSEEVISEPKTVYIFLPSSQIKKVTFVCMLLNRDKGWNRSEIKTEGERGFCYLEEINVISVQCGNFKAFNWSKGDKLLVWVCWTKTGKTKTYRIKLDNIGEQSYGE